MNRVLLFGSGVVLALVCLLLAPEVSAASTCTISATVCKGQSYVDTSTGGVAGAIRCFFFDTDSTLGNHVCSSTQDRSTWEMNAGSCVTLFYFDVVQGAVPPAVPNKVTFQVRFDTAATVIITLLNAGAEPANGASFSFCATSTGAAGGAARAGTYRIYLNPVKDNGAGGVGNYNVDSDGVASVGALAQFAKGALRGNMLVSGLAASSPPSGSQFAYGPAADESVTLTATRSQKNGGTVTETVSLDTRHASGGSIVETSSAAESAAAATDTASFVIDTTYDQASTVYDIEYNIVSNAGLTSLPWTTFPASGHGSGISQISTTKVRNTAQFTADPRIVLDRDGVGTFATADDNATVKLTSSSGPVTTLFNRGETRYIETFIFNARGDKLSRSMTFQTEDSTTATCVSIGSLTPTANKYSVTGAIGTSGCLAAFDTTGSARFLRVTNTDQNHLSVATHFVSSFYFTDYHSQGSNTLVKDDFPTQNANEKITYIISSDVMDVWCHVEGVRLDGTHIQSATNEVTIKETESDGTTLIGSSAASQTGSDGWTPSSPTHIQNPNSPARTIHGHCDITHNGNTGSDTQSIAWISAFTADKICRVILTAPPTPGQTTRVWVDIQKALVDITPESVPTLMLNKISNATWFDITGQFVSGGMFNAANNTHTVNGSLYYQDWVVPSVEDVNIVAACTIEGAQVQFGQSVAVAAPKVGDPVKVFSSPVIANPGETVTFIISESNGDGTARTGNAAGTFLYVYDGAGSLVLNGVTPTELQFGSYIYNYALGSTPVVGEWKVIARTTDPITGANIASSNDIHVETDGDLILATNFETLTGVNAFEFMVLLGIIILAILIWSRSTDFLVQMAMGLIAFVPVIVWISLFLTKPWKGDIVLAMFSGAVGAYLIIRASFDKITARGDGT